MTARSVAGPLPDGTEIFVWTYTSSLNGNFSKKKFALLGSFYCCHMQLSPFIRHASGCSSRLLYDVSLMSSVLCYAFFLSIPISMYVHWYLIYQRVCYIGVSYKGVLLYSRLLIVLPFTSYHLDAAIAPFQPCALCVFVIYIWCRKFRCSGVHT